MKTNILIIIFLLSVSLSFASDSYNRTGDNELNLQFSENNNITPTIFSDNQYQTGDSLLSILPIEIDKTLAPWGLPSFWFAFVLSVVGTYTLYGIVAAPIAVTVVYLSSKGNWQDTKRAIIGSLLGIAVGGAFKYFMMNI